MNKKHNWIELVEEYVLSRGMISAYIFCRQKNIDNSKFYRVAKSLGVEVRTCVKKDIVLDKTGLNQLEGHLLGDGSILYTGKNKRLPLFSISSKHRSYLEWIVNTSGWMKDRTIWTRNQYDIRTEKNYVTYWTRGIASQQMKEQRDRWYPDGKKIIPDDVKLTKESMLRWYMDDGCLHDDAISLSTDGFDKDGVDLLRNRLMEIGFDTTLNKNGHGWRIRIPKRLGGLFLEYIGPCPTECFSYKWCMKG